MSDPQEQEATVSLNRRTIESCDKILEDISRIERQTHRLHDDHISGLLARAWVLVKQTTISLEDRSRL
jgi:K+/H+ antiporter YhaU regulatory subunit KhtT